MDLLFPCWSAVCYIAKHVLYALYLTLFVLSIIATPLLNLGNYCLYACWYVSCVLLNFETLYIFFGTAALVGIITGTSLHYLSGFIMSILDLESSPEERRGRTLATYRVEKQHGHDIKEPITKLVQSHKDLQVNTPSFERNYTEWSVSNQSQGRRNGNAFNNNIILEEEDISDYC